MTGKTFVDSNILLYAHNVDLSPKHFIARTILTDLWLSGTGVLSPQVLQEFYVNSTRKISKPLTKAEAREIVLDFERWSIEVDAKDVVSAIRIESEARISFWDALICASAAKAGATILLSEDLNAGQTIAGLRILNPFLA